MAARSGKALEREREWTFAFGIRLPLAGVIRISCRRKLDNWHDDYFVVRLRWAKMEKKTGDGGDPNRYNGGFDLRFFFFLAIKI